MAVTNVKDVQTRALYEEVFEEDKQAFVDYYYKYKLLDNKIFQIMKEGKSVAMIHLNPFILNISTASNQIFKKIYYIVAVATQNEYRKQGMMDELLQNALIYMKEKDCPFTFLMPANPNIYRPYQFAYIYDRVDFSLNQKEIRMHGFSYHRAGCSDWKQLVEFSNKEQKIKYHVYVKRDIDYFIRLQQELISQDGNIYVIYDQKKLIGYSFTTNDYKEQWIQEALIGSDYEQCNLLVESMKKKAIIMARIIILEKVLKWITLKLDVLQPITFHIEVQDPLLKDNNGKFIWTVNVTGSTLESMGASNKNYETDKVSDINSDSAADRNTEIEQLDFKVSIEKFTSFLFGYQRAEECFEVRNQATISKLKKIQVLENIFINESV